MPVPQRRPSDATLQLVPLILVGMGLVTSNPSATILDDEAQTLSRATQPVHDLLAQFFSASSSSFPRPPLFQIVLHYWLRAAGANLAYLRIPTILLFVAGLFLLSRAARPWLGGKGGVAVIWAGALWPLGFHYGRLAIAPVFAFFLVCGLTMSVQKFLQERSASRWITLILFCVALTWTSYFAWAIVLCLAIELALSLQKSLRQNIAFGVNAAVLAGSAAVLAVALLPFGIAARRELAVALGARHGLKSALVNTAFSVYSLFVSESVAPWDWRFSIPAALALVLCLVLVVRWAPDRARRLLFYSAAMIAALALAGFLNMNALFIVSPWVLLPIGVAIETDKPQWANAALAAALLIIGGVGWYGIYARRYYSAPRFIEPWQQLADEAAGKARRGSMLIADQPSLLFYLTYDLQVPRQNGPWIYKGSVTEFVRDPRIFSPGDWFNSGRPTGSAVLLVRGGDDWGENSQIDRAAKQLDESCGAITSRLMVRDEGYAWKQRFFPERVDPLWRLELREYDCGSSNPKQPSSSPAP